MSNRTNLKEIKEVAKSLLYFDIQPDNKLSFFINHPFSDYNIVINPNDNTQLDLTVEEDLDIFRSIMKKIIDESNNYMEIYNRITKPFKSAFLRHTMNYLSNFDLGKALVDLWKSCDYVNVDLNITRSQYSKLFKKADPSSLMCQDEQEVLNSLPGIKKLYRGVNDVSSHPIDGMSWTDDIEIAKWFAKRYGGEGKVYSINAPKESILAYFTSESEYVVNYAYLKKHENEIIMVRD
mgnify:FL=1